MNKIDYGAVFGIDQGANDPAPAQQDSGTDAESKVESTPDGANAETVAGAKETEPAEQSAEENAKFAAARRKAEKERDAAIAQAQAAQRSLDEAIASMGQTDPYTGKPVTTKAEWDAWKAREAQEKSKEVAESAGMSETEFDNFVQNLPTVRDYRQAAEEARQQKQKMVLDEQITAIGKLDPSVKTVQDLMNRPEYKQIYDYVQKGNLSIVDAFKLANYDTLTQNAAAGARQAAINSANSKEHMAPTQARGSGAITVPDDVKAYYKLFNPKATDAEIQAHYNKYHKN